MTTMIVPFVGESNRETGIETLLVGDRLIAIFDNVPAGVCEQCGERYYRAEVLKTIEDFLKKKNFKAQIQLPLADFAKI